MTRHSLDAVSLVSGLFFAAVGVLFLTGIDVSDLASRFWPAALIVVGLALAFSTRSTSLTAAGESAPASSSADSTAEVPRQAGGPAE